MAAYENLPFERGNTMFGIGAGGSISTLVAADVLARYDSLIGREYKVIDPDYQGCEVTLMVVQYDGTGNLTAAKKCVDFTDALNTVFSDQAPGAGEVAYPLDHKYSGLVIKDGDLCYVITSGPCEVEAGGSYNAGDNLATATDGQLVAAQASDPFVVAYAVDSGSADTASTVMVGRNRGIE